MAAICNYGKQRFLEFQRVLNGGLKSRFRVILDTPPGVISDARVFDLMVSATSIPAMETTPISTKFGGQTMKISGDEIQSGEWTCTTLLNNGGGQKALTKAIADQWQKLAACSSNIDDYMTDAEIQLLEDKTGSPILRWRVEDIWVSNSGQLQLDYNNSELLSFDITFQYFDVIPLSV